MMDPRRKKIVSVLVVGSLILAWRVYALVAHLPAEVKGDAVAPTQPASMPVHDIADPMADVWKTQQALAARPWGRDPFVLQAVAQADAPAAAAQPDDMQLPPAAPPAVRFSGASQICDRRRAIVNGSIVAEGDVIGGDFRVVGITPRTVTLGSGGWTYEYTLGSDQPRVRRTGVQR